MAPLLWLTRLRPKQGPFLDKLAFNQYTFRRVALAVAGLMNLVCVA